MSSLFGDGGAGKAADATTQAAQIASAAQDRAIAEQTREFDQSQANLKPYLSTGTDALGKLAALYGVGGTDASGSPIGASGSPSTIDPNSTFYQSPDYQFKLSQGIKGVDAGAAARGMLDSGATRKAEIAYGGNLASSQFGSYADRLASLAGVGQSATNASANVGAQAATAAGNYATQIGNIAQTAGNNKASSYLAGGAAQRSGINGVLNAGIGLAGLLL